MNAREAIAERLWWVIRSSTNEEAKNGAGNMLDAYRAEVRREVGEWLLTQQVQKPYGEAEEHVNDVLQNLARELGAGE